MENNNVIRSIIFLQNSAWDQMKGVEATSREKKDIIASIQRMCMENLIIDCTIIEDKELMLYRIQQEEGITAIHIKSSDEYNDELANLLKRKQKNFVKETTIVIKDGSCCIDCNYKANKKEETYTNEQVIEKLKFLKERKKLKNRSKKEKIKGEESGFRYTFFTKREEKIDVYVASTEKKIIEQLDEIAEIQEKKQRHKKMLCGLGLGIVLTVSSPYVGRTVRFLYEEHTKQSEIQYLFESNMPRLTSLHRNLQKYGSLPEEQMIEFRDRVDCLITCIEENNLKDESYPLLLQYREEIFERENSMRGYKR